VLGTERTCGVKEEGNASATVVVMGYSEIAQP
jgi:hypothetical protein